MNINNYLCFIKYNTKWISTSQGAEENVINQNFYLLKNYQNQIFQISYLIEIPTIKFDKNVLKRF